MLKCFVVPYHNMTNVLMKCRIVFVFFRGVASGAVTIAYKIIALAKPYILFVALYDNTLSRNCRFRFSH